MNLVAVLMLCLCWLSIAKQGLRMAAAP
eukprot:COSAG02_NODE_38824_length_424_cov_0.950769_1_plen_27_part_01